jgi:hypothetical protein
MKMAVGVLSSENPNRNGDAISTPASSQSSAKCAGLGIWLFSDSPQSVDAATPIRITPITIDAAVAAPLS